MILSGEPPKFTSTGRSHGRIPKFIPYEMDMQISCRLYSEIPDESFILQAQKEVWSSFHELARHKESAIEQGVCCPNHVHMLISITPKFAVPRVIGYVKGKSTIHVAQHFFGKARNYTGQSLWARGFFVSTAGVNDEIIREYIRHQEEDDRHLEQLELFQPKSTPHEV